MHKMIGSVETTVRSLIQDNKLVDLSETTNNHKYSLKINKPNRGAKKSSDATITVPICKSIF